MEDNSHPLNYSAEGNDEGNHLRLPLQSFGNESYDDGDGSHDAEDRADDWELLFIDTLGLFQVRVVAHLLAGNHTLSIFKQEWLDAFEATCLVLKTTLKAVWSAVNALETTHIRSCGIRTLLVAIVPVHIVKVVCSITCQASILGSLTGGAGRLARLASKVERDRSVHVVASWTLRPARGSLHLNILSVNLCDHGRSE